MRALLTSGQKLRADDLGAIIAIGARLGGGTQGEVYAADMGGHPVAVKWYFPTMLAADPRLRDRLRMAVRRGSPSPAFLWPTDLAVGANLPGFGYVMELREPRYRGFIDVMTRQVAPSFRALATAAFQLSEGYHRLHALGLCYRDISFGNVALDPVTGEVKICDNDNVDVNGVAGAVIGTPRFMAPELVRNNALPTARTDLWSLAVLLFHAFMMSHPLEGKRETEFAVLDQASMQHLYGDQALFIFDPDYRSNAPVPGHHDNAIACWPIYPESLRRLFTRAFTRGFAIPRTAACSSRNGATRWRRCAMRSCCARVAAPKISTTPKPMRRRANAGRASGCWRSRVASRRRECGSSSPMARRCFRIISSPASASISARRWPGSRAIPSGPIWWA